MKFIASLLLVAAVALAAASCEAKLPTTPDTPIITLFSADALSVKTGTPVTLRWDVATQNADVRIDPMVGNVPVVGSTAIVLTATTTFTLNARSPAGASAQRVLTIVITP